jgi:acyl carrier protein
MDLLDIVFRLERAFDIEITREEFQAAFPKAHERELPVSHLLYLVLRKLPPEELAAAEEIANGDQGLATIQETARRWLLEELQRQKAPTSGGGDWLHSQLPYAVRRRTWCALRQQGLQVPSDPPQLGWAVVGALAGAVVGCAISLALLDGWPVRLGPEILRPLAAILWLPLALAGMFVCLGLSGSWSSETSAAQLADRLAALNVRFFAKQAQTKLRRDQVWAVIRRELSISLAIAEDRIHPESDLIKDLGAE